jgi:O-acetyl-ADP-ribose deacetylase
VAFPAISTGIYGYPLGDATAIAVRTVREALASPGSLCNVVFACFGDDVLAAYAAAGVS